MSAPYVFCHSLLCLKGKRVSLLISTLMNIFPHRYVFSNALGNERLSYAFQQSVANQARRVQMFHGGGGEGAFIALLFFVMVLTHKSP